MNCEKGHKSFKRVFFKYFQFKPESKEFFLFLIKNIDSNFSA